MTTEDIKQCEETTGHAELAGKGSCWCGFKKYKAATDPTYRCGWCGKLPEPCLHFDGELEGQPNGDVYCNSKDCPAYSNIVTLEVWQRRQPHEQLVARIPTDEPIFILRAQDALALIPGYKWIELAEKKEVDPDKVARALADIETMKQWQQANGSKIPD